MSDDLTARLAEQGDTPEPLFREPFYDRHGITVHHGDCLDVLATMADNSVDAVCTDPPYGLEFMGKDWDRPWAVGMGAVGYTDGAERLARPAFGDSRNANCRACKGRQRGDKRCTCAEPDWDRHPREDMRAFQRWCEAWARECLRVLKPGGYLAAFGGTRTYHRLACGIEDAGFEVRDSIGAPLAAWVHGQGFPKGKNQLKPAWEPIVLARKPPAGTLAANLLEHGTGALNIDGCRTAMSSADAEAINAKHAGMDPESYERAAGVSLNLSTSPMPLKRAEAHDGGRWPTNVLLAHAEECGGACVDGCPVAELDAQSGITRDGVAVQRNGGGQRIFNQGDGLARSDQGYGGQGGGSRYFPAFRWEAKAPTAERPQVGGLAHPTVKPLDLMRWLVRLVTPAGGLVLDPFAGSGTTLQAARAEGFRAVGIEREPSYLPLIKARLDARPRTAATTAPVPEGEPLDLLDLLGDAS